MTCVSLLISVVQRLWDLVNFKLSSQHFLFGKLTDTVKTWYYPRPVMGSLVVAMAMATWLTMAWWTFPPSLAVDLIVIFHHFCFRYRVPSLVWLISRRHRWISTATFNRRCFKVWSFNRFMESSEQSRVNHCKGTSRTWFTFANSLAPKLLI